LKLLEQYARNYDRIMLRNVLPDDQYFAYTMQILIVPGERTAGGERGTAYKVLSLGTGRLIVNLWIPDGTMIDWRGARIATITAKKET
jgi:hypothetical protein